ncbi:MAG: tRNA pseudouridine(55) synthase TruB [Clostridia bacterium]|nr:tRNA pseudouridine(55) synthase TruB [Clostridia bacterium]
MNGIINIYKPKGITSHDVVYKIRKLSGTKRVGHAGTLDPMATGVLPVLVGNACAAQDYIMEHDKTYVAGIRFGIITDTGDITGETLETHDNIPDYEAIKSVGESFVGEMKQVPPMYSAIKIGGKKLYELAREGITVEREERDITVYSSRLLEKINDTDYLFEFSVSKGTYIRTLGEDIGTRLGCGATLFSLERTVCGEFNKTNSHTIEELQKLSEEKGSEAVENLLLPTELSFSHLKVLKLPEFYSKLCKNGLEIYLSKIGNPELSLSEKVRLYDNSGEFFAIGEVGEFKNGIAVKARVRFDTVRK